jgi:hypothetical protein
MGGNGKGVYKHSADENWASDIRRQEAWDWMDHIVPAPTTYPVTQVSQTIMFAVCNITDPLCVKIMIPQKIILCVLCMLKTNHKMKSKLCLLS